MRGLNTRIGPPGEAPPTAAAARAPRGAGRAAWLALAGLLLAGAAVLVHETRSTTFWFDEWAWIVDRRGGDLRSFLAPHNQHLSLVPVLLYKLLFATAGLEHYGPYRALVIAGHVGCVALVFAYASRRVQSVPALLAATLILFLGPAWQNILWPFQIGSLISLGTGIGALLMLDRVDRLGDRAACGLLALSLASSGIGVVVAAGLVVDVLMRRGRRAAWIVAVPMALYGVWWLGYQDGTFVRHNLVVAPGFAADAAAAALSALAGLSGAAISENGTASESGATLGWGRPLALAAVALLCWWLARRRPIPSRVPALLTMLVSFWLLTGVQRAQISGPDASRYLYVGAIFLALLATELAGGLVLPRWGQGALAGAVALAVLANIGDLRDGARYVRAQAAGTRADLGALELARPLVKPGYVAASMPGSPFVVLTAGAYFAAAHALGSPAASPAEIAASRPDARVVADAELTRIHQVALEALEAAPGGRPPVVDAVAGEPARDSGPCVVFRPAPTGPATAASDLQLTLPASGVRLTAEAAPASVSVRRFAPVFPATAQGRLAPERSGVLRIGRDRASQPWHLRVRSEAPVTACGLRPAAH